MASERFDKAYLPAAIAVLRSLLRYPRRGDGFYRRMVQRAFTVGHLAQPAMRDGHFTNRQ